MSGLRRAFFLLFTASLALSIPTDLLGSIAASSHDNTGRLLARNNDEYPWVALGDSFSAGPGAGTPFSDVANDCYQNNGAYPPQLNNDFPFPKPAMQFLSCTGHLVVTLSIGGNDLGFGKVLRACVFKPGGPFSDDCDDTIKKARKYLDEKLEDTLHKAYDAVFNKITNDYKRKVFVQLYPSFFQEDTDWCNDQTMGIVPGYKPLLDNDLRKKLNSLTNDVRFAMKWMISNYANGHHEPHWFQTRLFYMDEFDFDTYPGHRFCEEGLETLDDPKIWFFTINGNDSPTMTAQQLLDQYDPSTCAADPKYDTDFAFGWYCESVRYVSSLGGKHSDFVTFGGGENIVQAFHPKTATFTSIKDEHKDAIHRLAWPRQTYTDLGNLQCKPARADGDEEFYASRDDMVQAMGEFCELTAHAGVTPGLVEGVFNRQIVSATRNAEAGDCPPLDVTSGGFVDMCKSRLINAIDGCDLEKRSSELWKQGGAFYRDCVTWYIGRQPYIRELSVSAANWTGV